MYVFICRQWESTHGVLWGGAGDFPDFESSVAEISESYPTTASPFCRSHFATSGNVLVVRPVAQGFPGKIPSLHSSPSGIIVFFSNENIRGFNLLLFISEWERNPGSPFLVSGFGTFALQGHSARDDVSIAPRRCFPALPSRKTTSLPLERRDHRPWQQQVCAANQLGNVRLIWDRNFPQTHSTDQWRRSALGQILLTLVYFEAVILKSFILNSEYCNLFNWFHLLVKFQTVLSVIWDQ